MVYNLLITAACSWYIAYVVTSTHGAFGMFERLREWRGGRWHGRKSITVVSNSDGGIRQDIRITPGLLDCIVCLIFWLALLIGYLEGLTIIESIAAAGVGLFLHGFTGWRYNVQ